MTSTLAASRLSFATVVSLFSIIIMTTTVEADNTIITTNSIIEGADLLEFDDDKKLSGYHFVYPATQNPDCVTDIVHNNENTDESDPYFKHVGLKGEVLNRVFPDYREEESSSRCLAACLEKGTDASVAGYTMPQSRYDSSENDNNDNNNDNDSDSSMRSWFRRSCKMVEVCLVNHVSRTQPLSIYWIDSKNRKPWKALDLKYGQKGAECFDSFLGHEFLVVLEGKDDDDDEFEQHRHPEFVEIITVEHATTKAFGEQQRPPPSSSDDRFDDEGKWDLEVKRTLELELAKHFVGGGLPNDVFASMGAFYYNNRNNVVNEQQWGEDGVKNSSFANWWETNIKVVTVPKKLKETWKTRLNSVDNDNDYTSSSSSSPIKPKMPPPKKRRRRKRPKNVNVYAAAPTYAPTLN